MSFFNITFKPQGKSLSIENTKTVLEAAAQAGLHIESSCGGRGTCGKCKVKIEPEGKEVLACQCQVKGDMAVTLPAGSRVHEQKILHDGLNREVKIEPMVSKIYLPLTVGDHVEFETKILATLSPCEVSGDARGQLKKFAYDFGQGITAVVHDRRVICFEHGDTRSEIFGVAVDIGTTTVVAKLVNLSDGQVKAIASEGNPQRIFGDDVISRISHGETEKGLEEMHDVIISCLNELIDELCKKAKIISEHIYEVTIAGNTTMSHIFLKLPVKQLGQAPYHAYSVDAFDEPASKLKLTINSAGNVHTIENIAGFVGSDTTACAVAASMDEVSEMTLVVDIGTNGELILGTKDEMYSASCAAGPALEGARIGHGSRAVPGAIERVSVVNGDIEIKTIADAPARTICGSGLIDAIAVMAELGIIDETGRFREPGEIKAMLPETIVKRVVETEPGQYAFVLASGPEAVILTQKDVRETQLAKAAIRAGMKLLQKKFGISDDHIKHVLLAGAFGNYIRKESAKRIGLLPDVKIERIKFIGNAASTGAQSILVSRNCRDLAGRLARQIKYIEIAHDPEFTMAYAESMMF